MPKTLISLSDFQDAQQRLSPFLRRTPVHLSHTLSLKFGFPVHLKLELFQKTGSFKPRAAFNRMLRFNAHEKARGVVAVSGGNFAQGVAFAGQTLGVQVALCMPEGAPKKSVEAAQSYGASVELFPDIKSAFAAAERLREAGRVFIHPFDEPDVVAGNGSLGLELLEDVPEATALIVSVGGGGLMAGVIQAVKAVKPVLRVFTVETEGADALDRAMRAGKVVEMTPTSLAKTLGAPFVSATALAVAQTHVERHVLVSDREAFEAQRFLLERTKVLAELSAACTLAAAEKIRGALTPADHLVLILCGGNVSLEDLAGYRERFG